MNFRQLEMPWHCHGKRASGTEWKTVYIKVCVTCVCVCVCVWVCRAVGVLLGHTPPARSKKLLGEKQVKDVSSCMVCAYSMLTMRYGTHVRPLARCGSDTAPHPLRADARRAHRAVHIQAHHVEVEVLVRDDRR